MPWPPPTHIVSSPKVLVGVAQAVDQGGHDAGAGHAERVADGDGAAVDVELVPRDAEVLGRRDDLGGERLVDLDEVDVVDGHAGAGEGLAAGLDRAEAHDLGVQAGDARGDDPGERREAELGGLGVAHDHHRGGAVVQRAGVAGGDLAVGPEHRLQVGEALGGGAGPDAVVAGDGDRLALVVDGVDRGDLVLPEAVLERGGGPLLREGGELVHLLAAHVLELGDVLGGLAHRDVDVGQALGRGPRALAALLALRGALAGLLVDRVLAGRRSRPCRS